jgi:hypothetical protein
MNIIEKYGSGIAIPDLEVVEFWKESLKDLTDVILTDHHSFPNNGKLFTDKFDDDRWETIKRIKEVIKKLFGDRN